MTEKKGIIKEFKTFIAKGNVMDLAVAVIIGGAFTSIVNSLVNDILMPLIGMFLAGLNFNDFGFTIPWGNNPYINIGSFIQATLTFFLTAICVFVIVKIINRNKKDVPKKEAEEVLLLKEIRDLLEKHSK